MDAEYRGTVGKKSGVWRTEYVNSSTDVEVKPPPGGWTYLFVQNNSTGDVYYNEGTMANADNCILLQSGQWLELSSNLGNALPQGTFWLKGSTAAPARQRVQIKGG